MTKPASLRSRGSWRTLVGGVVVGIVAFGAVAGGRSACRERAPLSADPTVHGAVTRWRERWPEPSGTAAEWRAQARQAWADGYGRTAGRALERAAVLEPTDDTLLWLVSVSARWPALVDLDPVERQAILHGAAGRTVQPGALAGAAAWDHLGRGEVDQALAWVAVPQVDGPLALSALVHAQRLAGQDASEAALALHRAVPDDVEGCREAARAQLARGELWEAEAVVVECRLAGVGDPVLDRILGDVLDAAGQPAEACGAYAAAGAALHAAAIIVQDGACDPAQASELVVEALGQASAQARLHATWAAVLAADPQAAARARTALEAARDVRAPPFRAAAAAALLVEGRPDEALAVLGELQDAPSQVLAARALAAVGRPAQALERLDAAWRQQPWRLEVHRARAALVAELEPARLSAVMVDLADEDPVALALAALEPDRLLPWAAIVPQPWPDRLLSARERAIVQALAGSGPGAEAPAELVPADDLDGAVARARLAGHLLGTGPRQQVDPLVELLIVTRPQDPIAAGLVAVALSEGGQQDQAVAWLARAQQEGAQTLTPAWAAAMVALRGGSGQLAVERAEELVRLHPERPGTRALRYAVQVQAEAAADEGLGP